MFPDNPEARVYLVVAVLLLVVLVVALIEAWRSGVALRARLSRAEAEADAGWREAGYRLVSLRQAWGEHYAMSHELLAARTRTSEPAARVERHAAAPQTYTSGAYPTAPANRARREAGLPAWTTGTPVPTSTVVMPQVVDRDATRHIVAIDPGEATT